MTHEQKALLKKAGDSIRGARLLADDGLYDFAVSRAYYAMFYVAEAFLLKEGLAFSKHSAVISAFGKKFAKTGYVPYEFHQYLIEAGDNRNIGDYDIESDISEKKAYNQIENAEKFLELGYRLLGEIPHVDMG